MSVAAGAALLGAAMYLKRSNRLNWQGVCDTAGELVDGLKNRFSSSETVTDHGGQKLAQAARQRAAQSLGRA